MEFGNEGDDGVFFARPRFNGGYHCTVARARDGYLNQREMEFREEQGAFPNEIWERGNEERRS